MDAKATVFAGTVEAWASDYIRTVSLLEKCAPADPPARWEADAPERDIRPVARPPELCCSERARASPRPAALRDPRARARLLHTFWFHELQAAELMCWALLKFPESEPAFREGLLRIWRDEVRHMGLYQAHIESLGFRLGDFEVRDWFWHRVPTCHNPTMFVALLGMGLEAANLEHAPRFAQWFRAAGDEAGASLQERVGREEIAHVRFACRWFAHWTGSSDFASWRRNLPAPLTPLLMRGKTLNRAARRRAGMSDEFIDHLASYRPEQEE